MTILKVILAESAYGRLDPYISTVTYTLRYEAFDLRKWHYINVEQTEFWKYISQLIEKPREGKTYETRDPITS